MSKEKYPEFERDFMDDFDLKLKWIKVKVEWIKDFLISLKSLIVKEHITSVAVAAMLVLWHTWCSDWRKYCHQEWRSMFKWECSGNEGSNEGSNYEENDYEYDGGKWSFFIGGPSCPNDEQCRDPATRYSEFCDPR